MDAILKLQRSARGFFDAGRFADALPLYRAASTGFRTLVPTNWVRVFFCEATALRCLENLGFSDESWLREYQVEFGRFLQEWSEDRIRLRIYGIRQHEALETILSRKTGREYWSQRVDQAIEKALQFDF